MGGTAAKRKDNPIRLMKKDCTEPGKYGDPIGQKICGVKTDTIELPTRLHQWRIERCTVDFESVNRHAALAAQPPWSSVNNCTQENYNSADEK